MLKKFCMSLLVIVTMTANIQVQAGTLHHEVFAQEANPQMKVVANNSDMPSININQSPQQALANIIEYDLSHIHSLRARAIAFGLINSDEKAESWVFKEDGKTFLNRRGQEVADKLATYLAGAEVRWADGKTVGPVRVDGLDKDTLVVNDTTKVYEGWEFLSLKTRDGNSYYISAWCGNNAYPGGETPPGLPQHPLPGPPGSSSEKDPSKDPATQGNAPKEAVGRNADLGPGAPSEEAPTPPARRVNPLPPMETPSKKEEPPSNWTGEGSFTDSNGETAVKDGGEVKTPQGETLPQLVQTPPPPAEPGAGKDNGSLPEPPTDEDW